MFVQPKHLESLGSTGMLEHMCVLVICVCVCVPLCFLFLRCLFSGSRGVFLEVQTSLNESKFKSWERSREVKERQREALRGGQRLNKQRWWWLPVITTHLSGICGEHHHPQLIVESANGQVWKWWCVSEGRDREEERGGLCASGWLKLMVQSLVADDVQFDEMAEDMHAAWLSLSRPSPRKHLLEITHTVSGTDYTDAWWWMCYTACLSSQQRAP